MSLTNDFEAPLPLHDLVTDRPVDTGDMGPAPIPPPGEPPPSWWGEMPPETVWVSGGGGGGGRPMAYTIVAKESPHYGAPMMGAHEFYTLGAIFASLPRDQPVRFSAEQLSILRAACNIAGRVAELAPMIVEDLSRKR